MALPDYAPNTYAPKFLGDVSLVVIQATMVGGAVVHDAANSSPETGITLPGAGNFAITFPPGQFVHLVGCFVSRETEAAGVGQSVHFETLLAAGTGSFETTSETVDTPVTPTNGSRIYITLLVGSN